MTDKKDELKRCPFCACKMGILYIDGGWMWYGFHDIDCILEGNPSGLYGRKELMIKAWNTRRKEPKKRKR